MEKAYENFDNIYMNLENFVSQTISVWLFNFSQTFSLLKINFFVANEEVTG